MTKCFYYWRKENKIALKITELEKEFIIFIKYSPLIHDLFNTGYNIEVDDVLMKVSPIRPHDIVLISHITM